jgi:hypothetical protein
LGTIETIEELQSILSCHIYLSANVHIISEYIQTYKFAAFNAIFYREFKSEKVKKYNAWDEQSNIDLAMKQNLYNYNLFFTTSLYFFITIVKLSLNNWLIIFLYVDIFNMF